MKHLRIKYTPLYWFTGSPPGTGTLAVSQRPFAEVFYEANGPPEPGGSGRSSDANPSLELPLTQRDQVQES